MSDRHPGTKQTLPLTPPESPEDNTSPPLLPPKYTFLPTHTPSETPSSNSIDSFAYSSDDITGSRPYGILGGTGSKVTLGLEDVGKVVRDVGAELDRRGQLIPLPNWHGRTGKADPQVSRPLCCSPARPSS